MRPIKERHIEKMPPVTLFKPAGVPLFAGKVGYFDVGITFYYVL